MISLSFWVSLFVWNINDVNINAHIELRPLLLVAIEAALQASEAILAIYDKTFEVSYKDDDSPLTEADLASNAIICNRLRTTDIPIISEENKGIPYSIRKDWKSCWIVDPIDGTKEFIKRNGDFTVNIALVEQGVTKLGVIYIPVTKELYYNNVEKNKAFKTVLDTDDLLSKDLGSILFKEADAIKPSSFNQISRLKVVGSRSHMNAQTSNFIKGLEKHYDAIEIVSRGSSLKFCLVAEGKAHMYPRFAPTMEWDTAAGQAICEAVGLSVIDQETGEPLVYNRAQLRNPFFMVSVHG
ncbi:3'(2'),5'-bisphosphate nucleotidase CysQ [Gaetbulibacter saemankumensis]|uniref:3'(2'),5'-bisphosphate nucleotidase CysQ n=1 Tax=Gaetbulibacter saemankumensis TaxID=311208 RepID=UPI00040D7C76|nr:3'(2'),5'-bisphosphate nucleotidase CysQ [Gaetbulibacter saemankumensis]